jgi:hypothetical protein
MRFAFRAVAFVASLAIAPEGASAADPVARAATANLAHARALVDAGGGDHSFDALTLIETLGGDGAAGELAALTKEYGVETLRAYLDEFHFFVTDALGLAAGNGNVLPAPQPDPQDGRALLDALWSDGAAGKPPHFATDRLFDSLFSPAVRIHVLNDATAKFGTAATTSYTTITARIFTDLHAAGAK